MMDMRDNVVFVGIVAGAFFAGAWFSAACLRVLTPQPPSEAQAALQSASEGV